MAIGGYGKTRREPVSKKQERNGIIYIVNDIVKTASENVSAEIGMRTDK